MNKIFPCLFRSLDVLGFGLKSSESRQLAQILILFHFFYTVCCYHLVCKCMYTEGYSESTEPINAVNILPLARFEPTTSATPPSTTPDINATNCATESSPKKGSSGSADTDDD